MIKRGDIVEFEDIDEFGNEKDRGYIQEAKSGKLWVSSKFLGLPLERVLKERKLKVIGNVWDNLDLLDKGSSYRAGLSAFPELRRDKI